VFSDINEEAVSASPDDSHPVVELSFAVHAFGEIVGSQDIDSRLLEHSGANAREDVLASVFLQHEARHASAVKYFGKKQSGRTGPDDDDLWIGVATHRLSPD
jgi:hypothetical protein